MEKPNTSSEKKLRKKGTKNYMYRVCQKMTQLVYVRTSSNLHQI